jgi:prolyl 4-hydroxylase
MRTEYRGDIAELEQYLRMAMPQPVDEQEKAMSGTSKEQHASPTSYHEINPNYPGVKTLHKDPNVLEIDNFLTHDECDRLITKAQPHLIPCVTKNPATGAVEVDPDRTSTNANVPQVEIPTIVSKLMDLTNIHDPSRLEIFQVLHYTNGQEFKEHTDGFSGPTTACGYKDSGRLVTIFCYLNDVEKGGETRFTQLQGDNSTPLDVMPAKGKAVIHFPATNGLDQDPRTEHQGMKAVDDKWLLVTWVWLHSRSDDLYSEKHLPSLSADIV